MLSLLYHVGASHTCIKIGKFCLFYKNCLDYTKYITILYCDQMFFIPSTTQHIVHFLLCQYKLTHEALVSGKLRIVT